MRIAERINPPVIARKMGSFGHDSDLNLKSSKAMLVRGP